MDLLSQLEDDTSEPTVSAPPAKEEVHNTYLPDFDLTVGTDAALTHEERQHQLYENLVAAKFRKPWEELQAVEFPRNQDVPLEGYEKTSLTFDGKPFDGGAISSSGEQLISKYDLPDLVPEKPKQTPAEEMGATPRKLTPEGDPLTDTFSAFTYGARRVGGEYEKSLWAIAEAGLRSAKAIYQYAPDTATDFFIKRNEKQQTVGRLTQYIDYFHQPEKYGYVAPQADEDRRLNEITAYQRNYYYGLLNSVAESVLDVTALFAEMGLMPQAKIAKYSGEALPYLKSAFLHSIKTVAPFAMATTSGGLSERAHAALMFTAFGMVTHGVNMIGVRRLTATMIAAAMNTALTAPDIVKMYKSEGGINKDFFKLFVPLILGNFAFAAFIKSTNKSQFDKMLKLEAKRVASISGRSVAASTEMLKVAIKEYNKKESVQIATAEELKEPNVAPKEEKPIAAVETKPDTKEVAKPTEADLIDDAVSLMINGDVTKKTKERVLAEMESERTERERVGDKESGFARENLDVIKRLRELGLDDLAKYLSSNFAEQSTLATDLIRDYPALAKRIAVNGDPVVGDSKLQGLSVYLEMLNKAKAEGNGELVLELVKSPYASKVSQAGNTLSAVSHLLKRDATDPVSAIKKINEAHEQIFESSKEVSSLKKKLEELERKNNQLMAAKAKRRTAIGGEYGSRNKLVTKSEAESLSKEIRESASYFSSTPFDPVKLYKVTKVGLYHAEAGLREFKVWSEKMITELGEKVKPHLDDIWKQVNMELEKSKLDAIKTKISNALERDKDIGFNIQSLAEYAIEKGVHGKGNITEEGRVKILDWVQGELKGVGIDMTRREVADEISRYGDLKKLNMDETKVKVRDLKGQLQKVSALEDIINERKAPLKSGVERQEPSDLQRALTKQINEAKKLYKIETVDPAVQLKSSLDSIKTRLTNQIADLDSQIKSGKKIVEGKTQVQYDAEALALRDKRDALKKEFDAIFDTPMSDAKRVELATKAAERQVAELNRRITEGELTPEKQTSSAWSPEISKLKQESISLKEQIEILKEMENPSLTPEERDLKNLKRRLERDRINYEEKISALDFEAKQAKEAKYDAEALENKRETDRVRKVYNDLKSAAPSVTVDQANKITELSKIASEKYKLIKEEMPLNAPERLDYGRAEADYATQVADLQSKATDVTLQQFKEKPIQTAAKILWEVGGLKKTVDSSGDLGGFFTQGYDIGKRHPFVWTKNAAQTIKDLVGELQGKDVRREARARLTSRPNWVNGEYAKQGLHLLRAEEAMTTRFLERMPLGIGKFFKLSDIAYTHFLQGLRADVFDLYHGAITATHGSTKGLGILANSATGRGDLGKDLEKGADLWNVAFFSPRNMKSRTDMITAHVADWHRMSPDVRKRAIINTVVAFAVDAVVLTTADQLSQMFGNESGRSEADPRGSNFGQVRINNTLGYDVTAQKAGYITTASRIILNGIKDSRTGITKDVWSEEKVYKDALGIITSFATNKLSPSWGQGYDFLRNMKNFQGEPLSWRTEVGRDTPFTAQTAAEAFDVSEGTVPEKMLSAAAITAPDVLGIHSRIKKDTPKSIVTLGDTVQAEINRLDKIGDTKGSIALEKKNKKILSVADDLRDYQKTISDKKKELRDVKADLRTTEAFKAQSIKAIEKEIEKATSDADKKFEKIRHKLR